MLVTVAAWIVGKKRWQERQGSREPVMAASSEVERVEGGWISAKRFSPVLRSLKPKFFSSRNKPAPPPRGILFGLDLSDVSEDKARRIEAELIEKYRAHGFRVIDVEANQPHRQEQEAALLGKIVSEFPEIAQRVEWALGAGRSKAKMALETILESHGFSPQKPLVLAIRNLTVNPGPGNSLIYWALQINKLAKKHEGDIFKSLVIVISSRRPAQDWDYPSIASFASQANYRNAGEFLSNPTRSSSRGFVLGELLALLAGASVLGGIGLSDPVREWGEGIIKPFIVIGGGFARALVQTFLELLKYVSVGCVVAMFVGWLAVRTWDRAKNRIFYGPKKQDKSKRGSLRRRERGAVRVEQLLAIGALTGLALTALGFWADLWLGQRSLWVMGLGLLTQLPFFYGLRQMYRKGDLRLGGSVPQWALPLLKVLFWFLAITNFGSVLALISVPIKAIQPWIAASVFGPIMGILGIALGFFVLKKGRQYYREAKAEEASLPESPAAAEPQPDPVEEMVLIYEGMRRLAGGYHKTLAVFVDTTIRAPFRPHAVEIIFEALLNRLPQRPGWKYEGELDVIAEVLQNHDLGPEMTKKVLKGIASKFWIGYIRLTHLRYAARFLQSQDPEIVGLAREIFEKANRAEAAQALREENIDPSVFSLNSKDGGSRIIQVVAFLTGLGVLGYPGEAFAAQGFGVDPLVSVFVDLLKGAGGVIWALVAGVLAGFLIYGIQRWMTKRKVLRAKERCQVPLTAYQKLHQKVLAEQKALGWRVYREKPSQSPLEPGDSFDVGIEKLLKSDDADVRAQALVILRDYIVAITISEDKVNEHQLENLVRVYLDHTPLGSVIYLLHHTRQAHYQARRRQVTANRSTVIRILEKLGQLDSWVALARGRYEVKRIFKPKFFKFRTAFWTIAALNTLLSLGSFGFLEAGIWIFLFLSLCDWVWPIEKIEWDSINLVDRMQDNEQALGQTLDATMVNQFAWQKPPEDSGLDFWAFWKKILKPHRNYEPYFPAFAIRLFKEWTPERGVSLKPLARGVSRMSANLTIKIFSRKRRAIAKAFAGAAERAGLEPELVRSMAQALELGEPIEEMRYRIAQPPEPAEPLPTAATQTGESPAVDEINTVEQILSAPPVRRLPGGR